MLNGLAMKSSAPSSRPKRLVDLVVARREQEQRDEVLILPQLPAEREAVEAGHVDVGDHHVGPVLTDGGEPRDPVARRLHAVARVLEQQREDVEERRIVVDEQDHRHGATRLTRGRAPASPGKGSQGSAHARRRPSAHRGIACERDQRLLSGTWSLRQQPASRDDRSQGSSTRSTPLSRIQGIEMHSEPPIVGASPATYAVNMPRTSSR